MNAALVIFAAAIVVPIGVIECQRKWRDWVRSGHGQNDYLPSCDGAPGKAGKISPSAAKGPGGGE